MTRVDRDTPAGYSKQARTLGKSNRPAPPAAMRTPGPGSFAYTARPGGVGLGNGQDGVGELAVQPLCGVLGAEVLGVDLSQPLSDSVMATIRGALLDYEVVFFRDQELSRDAQVAFAQRFGKPDIHPIANGMTEHPEVIKVWKPAGESASFGTGWHTDNSFFQSPTILSFLYGVTIPPFGGDTLYASTTRAYEALSETMRGMLDELVAVHSASAAYDPKTTGEAKYRGETAITYRYSSVIEEEVEHPVIQVHPESGRRSIYVNPMFTQRIVGLTARESDALLQLLYRHVAQPDFQCRFRWQPGSLALWDNRVTQHYALDDYREHERLMYRVTVSADTDSAH
jgi:taurine dioxygenase